MEGLFIGSWTSKTKVGDLDARVRARGVQQNVLWLSQGGTQMEIGGKEGERKQLEKESSATMLRVAGR